MTESLRVSVYTSELPSVTSRCNLKATMVPVSPVNRCTKSIVGWLTGRRGVDMKDESHSICAFSSKKIYHFLTSRMCGFFYHTLYTGARINQISVCHVPLPIVFYALPHSGEILQTVLLLLRLTAESFHLSFLHLLSRTPNDVFQGPLGYT
jgi:hypothetical protein